MRLVFLACAGFGVLSAGIYVWFFSGAFEVTKVEMAVSEKLSGLGVRNYSESWLNQERFKIKKSKNIFSVNTEEISALLLENFPDIKSVSIKKEGSHNLIFNIEERKPEGIWCRANGCFYFDDAGIAFGESGDSSGFILATVRDLRGGEVFKGRLVTDGQWLDSIFLVRDFLPVIGLSAKEFIIPADSFDEFIVETAAGFKIFMKLSTDISDQLNSFALAWKEKITPAQKALMEYVDLKVDRRIYYK